MNKNLEKAIMAVEKADGIMYAIEKTYLDFEISKEELEKANRGINAFYALWDIVKEISESLERLEGDSEVVDVMKALKESRN